MKNEEFILGELILLEKFPVERILAPEGLSTKYYYSRKAKYRCFCGKEFITEIGQVTSKKTKSCGCYRLFLRHTQCNTHGKTHTRLFSVWRGIKQRCNNLNDSSYQYYGGRGITVCEEWKNDFEKFYNWSLANGYTDELTIDRINPDGNYEPDNCRWVNFFIQNINKRPQKNKTGYPGVRKKKNDHFDATIRTRKGRVSLGTFLTKEEAFSAYEKARKERDEIYLKEFEESKKK